MTPLREALVLPCLFLTVALLGGLRVTHTDVRLLPPPLTALMLAMLLFGTLIRSGVLAPERLLNPGRSGLENLSGLMLIAALFGATTQAVNLVLPERGLLHAGVGVLLFVQILTLNAARPGRLDALRSLVTLFGALFVLRFIVIESLYSSDAGVLKRLLTTLLSGVTLGGIEYQPNAAITGYAAFGTLVIYGVGLLLLPARDEPVALTRATPPAGLTPVTGLLLALALASASACRADVPPAEPPPARSDADAHAAPLYSAEGREAALRAARVWTPPAVPIPKADLGANPVHPGAFAEQEDVDCRIVLDAVGGTTPKFHCRIAAGDVVKVKYGEGNAELGAEVAASRLISALGFGADRMYRVRSVRCGGCPAFPFQALRCLATTRLERACFPGGIDYERATVFPTAVVERRLAGEPIEAVPDQGWAWFELERIDEAEGGSPTREVDALRLLAAFLAHWDNKAENQRLVCLPGGRQPDGRCTKPFAIMQDLGATFGPNKMDLHNWRQTPVWADAATCRVSMEQLPFGGGTFPERTISEDGRRFLADLLGQLAEPQIQALFTRSGATTIDGITAEGRDPAAWTRVFTAKVREIAERRCPADSRP